MMIQEIHPNSAPVYHRNRDGPAPMEYYHSLRLQLQGGTARKIYVGDVVCVDCPPDEEDILVPPSRSSSAPSSGNNGSDPCWYPFDRPWKVGLVLALWSTTTPDGESYDMALQWLHRDIHLPHRDLHYKRELQKRSRPEERHAMVLESRHIQTRMGVQFILPQAFVTLSSQTFQSNDIVEESHNNNNNNNQQLELKFSIAYALTDLSMDGIEASAGWENVIHPTPSAKLGARDALVRAWKLLERQTSLDEAFFRASRQSYQDEAPLRVRDRQKRQDEWAHQRRVAEELERLEQQQQQQQQQQERLEAKQQAASTRQASAKQQTAKKKTAPKAKTVVKRKTVVKAPKPTKVKAKPKAKAGPKAKTKPGPKAKARPGPKPKTKSKVAPKKKQIKSTTATKKARKTVQDDDGEEELAQPIGRAVSRTGQVSHYASVRVPCHPQQWHTSLRRRSGGASHHHHHPPHSWTFHVGDILAVASNDCTPPPHFGTTTTKQWYPFSKDTEWCPAIVLDIYKDPEVAWSSHGVGGNGGAASNYTMKLQWLVRWGDLDHTIQTRLQDFDHGRLATQLQTVPHMVVETNTVDDFPVTAALGKLAIVGAASQDRDIDIDIDATDEKIPPSVTLQCHYKIRFLAAGEPFTQTYLGKKGTIDNFMTPVTDWDHHYQKVSQGGFQAWRRMVEEENDNTADNDDDAHEIPVDKYWKFLSKGKTIAGWINQRTAKSTAPAKTTARTSAMANAKKQRKPKPAVAPRFMTEFQSELPSVSSSRGADDMSEMDSPAAVSHATDSTAAEDRILTQFQKPMHKDKSSGRLYYDRIQIRQPFDAYAITTTVRGSSSVDSQQPQPWELKVGDVVVARYEGHYKANGSTYFEPDAMKFPIAARENSKHYPFFAAWGGKCLILIAIFSQVILCPKYSSYFPNYRTNSPIALHSTLSQF